MSTHTPPLHAALDYCARKLLAELERGPAALPDAILASRLTPTSAALLRWWCAVEYCNTRVDNFHAGQKQAILHTVLAHELLQTDDPEWLYRLACDPARARLDAPAASACPTRYAGYVLRMAPGSGLRWVAQALLIWQWANHIAARASGHDDPRFSSHFLLSAATDPVRVRLQDALFGAADARGQRDAVRSSPIRHAALFLPPSLRDSFGDWLARQTRSAKHEDAMCFVDVASETTPSSPPITLVAGVGARMLGGATHAHDDPESSRHASLLWIDLALSQASTAPCAGSAPIAEFPLQRAIRDGAVKLPMLEPTQHLRMPPLRETPPRPVGLRPRLSRAHRSLLGIGIEALSRRDAGFVAIDSVRRPKLLVLCDAPHVVRGVRHALTAYGLDKSAIAARVVIDTLPAHAIATDARICVIVVLRTGIDPRTSTALLAPALPPLWPEPDFAVLRSENRERAVLGRSPAHLIDVLSVVEHPQRHADYTDLLRAGLAARGGDPCGTDAVGDLIVTGLRADADDFEIALQGMSDGRAVGADRLSELPRRILRARQSMPVRKSVYTHAGWSAYDNGLRRAFLECAECDPGVESHCLLDPRRHAMRLRDSLLAQGISPLGLPDALVRTVDAVYLVDFLPSCPAQPQPAGPSERALTRWCAHTNALPAVQRQHRRWHRVQLQAPLFWSWKRSEGMLSALLVALAGTAPLARRGRAATTAY
ncbi:MAG: hypothetical protein HOP03_09830 [Lysobacter sp.]|nr:hypothetical protein [Lysobacter sp.]